MVIGAYTVLLPLDATQEQFDNWRNHYLREQFGFVDTNDAIMVWLFARELYNKHPHLRRLIKKVTPECVERARTDLGIFMGGAYLCRKVGLNFDKEEELLLKPFKLGK